MEIPIKIKKLFGERKGSLLISDQNIEFKITPSRFNLFSKNKKIIVKYKDIKEINVLSTFDWLIIHYGEFNEAIFFHFDDINKQKIQLTNRLIAQDLIDNCHILRGEEKNKIPLPEEENKIPTNFELISEEISPNREIKQVYKVEPINTENMTQDDIQESVKGFYNTIEHLKRNIKEKADKEFTSKNSSQRKSES